MTDSTNEKPTPRHNRLNSQTEDFDFELVDVPVTPDQENPTHSPLDSFVASDSTPIIPPTQVVSEIKTNFYVDYFDKRKKIDTVDSEPVLAADMNPSSTVDNRSQDTMILEKNPETPTDQPYTEDVDSESPLDSHAPVVNGAGMAVAVLSQFKSKQESINKQQEKLIQEFSQKIKSATTVTYTAVFFGVVALVAATTLGVMLLKTKSEVSDLAGTTTALKDNIKNIAKTTPDELEGTDPSIDQLNQKVDDVIEQLNEVTERQNKAALVEKTAVNKSATTKPLDAPQIIADVTEKTPASTPVKTPTVTTKPLDNHQMTANVIEKKPPVATPVKALATTKPLDNHQMTTNVAEKKAPATTPVKATPATKTAKNSTTEKTAPVVNTATTIQPQTTSKTASKSELSTPKKINEIPDKALAVPANDINKVINTASPQAAPPATNKAAPQISSGWTVNLGSSNRLDDAKNTAARFAQKGIPVTVYPVTVKNETRYRLQVKGFKTKDEAAAYANKAKDTLKLNSVWINP